MTDSTRKIAIGIIAVLAILFFMVLPRGACTRRIEECAWFGVQSGLVIYKE
jgi:hypothetical protein